MKRIGPRITRKIAKEIIETCVTEIIQPGFFLLFRVYSRLFAGHLFHQIQVHLV